MSYTKNFDSWSERKKQIDASHQKLFCNTREVWWIYLGVNVGFEQDGKNEDFVRPVLILRKFNNQIFLGIPLSTRLKSDNKFYVELEHNKITTAAVISQIRLFDIRRLKRKMYRLDKSQFERVQTAVRAMIGDKK